MSVKDENQVDKKDEEFNFWAEFWTTLSLTRNYLFINFPDYFPYVVNVALVGHIENSRELTIFLIDILAGFYNAFTFIDRQFQVTYTRNESKFTKN